MTRPLRLEFQGDLYHITSRGDRRENIYKTDGDRQGFISLLAKVCETYNWTCHAYCLMDNHYHLLVETPEVNLSEGCANSMASLRSSSVDEIFGVVATSFRAKETGLATGRLAIRRLVSSPTNQNQRPNPTLSTQSSFV